MEHVYPELRLMAHRYLKDERQANTLQTTALVHEVYLRLVDVTKVEWQPARAVFCDGGADDAAHFGGRGPHPRFAKTRRQSAKDESR